jgi:hypothetical protein
MEPYKFKKIIFNNGFLNESCDATYIIHLEGNGRYNDIQKQLLEYNPTNIIYILFNKGYKKSKKKPFIINSMLDLVDANIEIFNHAKKKKYNNILILEDDFIFSEKIKEKNHQNNINTCINKLKNKKFLYTLGCFPAFFIPYNLYNYKTYSGGTHAVIFSKKSREEILKIDQQKIKDWDIINRNIMNKYTYYIPLCYQLITDTENSQNWGYDNIFNKIIAKIILFTVKIIKLDKQVEPATSICYTYSKLLLYSIIIIIIYFIYSLYKKLNLYK